MTTNLWNHAASERAVALARSGRGGRPRPTGGSGQEQGRSGTAGVCYRGNHTLRPARRGAGLGGLARPVLAVLRDAKPACTRDACPPLSCSCRSQDESRQIFEIRGSFGQILRLNRCESQPLPHTFTTPLCLYHSKPCLLPSGKFLIFFFALKKQGIHEEFVVNYFSSQNFSESGSQFRLTGRARLD